MLKKRLKAVYLLFLAFPVAFYLLYERKNVEKTAPDYDYFYFSAKSSAPLNITLKNSDYDIAQWQLNSGAFKYFDVQGKLNAADSIMFRIGNARSGDTVTFLAINAFSNNQLYSYNFKNPEKISVTNCSVIQKDGCVSFVVLNETLPVNIKISPLLQWKHKNPEKGFKLLLFTLFALVFIAIFILTPNTKYFTVSVFIGLIVMFSLRLLIKNDTAKIRAETTTEIKHAEFYYNHFPQFSHLKRHTYDKASKYFEANIDIATDRYIRFDIDNVEVLKDLSITVTYGIMSKTWDFQNIPQENLLINDMTFHKNGFKVQGNDAFFALTTRLFIDDIKWLIMLHRSRSLFAGLFVFLILIILNYRLARYFEKSEFKYIYLLFFIVPASFFIIENSRKTQPIDAHDDYLYFPVKTTKACSLTLLTTKDSIATWSLNTKGFKQIHLVKNFNDSNGFTLKIKELSILDTVFLPVVNLYRKGTLYSLYDMTYPYCAVENAVTFMKNGIFGLIPAQNNQDIKIHFLKSSCWEKTHENTQNYILPILLFILSFLIVFIISPSGRYFSVVVLLSVPVMLLFKWIGNDVQDQLIFKSHSPQPNMESYYSNTPFFSNDNKFMTDDGEFSFRMQVEPLKHHYLRVDIGSNTTEIINPEIILKTGFISKKWNFTQTNLSYFIPNDIDYRNGKLLVTGNDPYVALTSVRIVNEIKAFASLRSIAYIIVTLCFFILLLILSKVFAKLHPVTIMFTAGFVFVISYTLLFSPFNSARIRLYSEKRNAEKMPVFTSDSIKSFNKKLGLYLSDNLAGRNKIIPLNNYLYFSVFGELANHPQVYFGKDGWMFYIGAKGRETYENRNPLTEHQLLIIKYLLEERNTWLKERGIKLYIFFPKISQFIYEDKLGKRMFRHHTVSKLEQLQNYLKKHSSLNIIDLEKPLLEAKKFSDKELYHKTSTHWNYYGAYFAYREVINSLRKDFPEIAEPIPLNEIQWQYCPASKYDIDLLEMTALANYLKGYTYKPLHPNIYAATDTVTPIFSDYTPDFPTLYVVNKNRNSPNMIMFRDSYAEYFYPYFCYHFHKSAFLWTPTFNRILIEKEKPDIVLWEMTERFIPGYFVYKNPPFVIEELQKKNKKIGFPEFFRAMEQVYHDCKKQKNNTILQK